MGRKPTTKNTNQKEKVHRTFRFCKTIDDMLDLYSEQFGKYKSFVVETALTEYLDKNVKVGKSMEDDCNDEQVKRSYVIDVKLDDRLNTYCLVNGVTKSFILERSLEQYLEKYL